jgi:hypothetical protein
MDNRIDWVCPHCFTTIPWDNIDAVQAHTCEIIEELIQQRKSATARLDAVIKVLVNAKGKQ